MARSKTASKTASKTPSTPAGPALGAAHPPGHLEVQALPVTALEPNPWNPNRMNEETRAKLTAYLRREGLVQPLVVRRHPEAADRYQILGGEHRWRVCSEELGWSTVPCVVVPLDDRRAKVLTVNLNELSGEAVPHLMAELVHDLSRDSTLSDLATQMPYTERQLRDLDELLKVPTGLELELDQAAKAHRDGSPTLLTFVVDEPEPVEAAIEAVAATLQGKNRRGRALTLLCRHVSHDLPIAPEPTDEVAVSGFEEGTHAAHATPAA